MSITAEMHDGTQLEFPDGTDPAIIQGAIKKVLATRQGSVVTPAEAPRPVSSPEQMTLGERAVQMLPKGAQNWLSNPSIASVPIGRGSSVNGAMMGAADPVVGLGQLAANLTSAGPAANAMVANKEAEYQNARAGMGRDGADVARFAGNVGITLPVGGAAAVPQKLGMKMLQGGALGGAFGAAAPVTDTGDYWGDKLKQALLGSAGGAAISPLAAGLARAISPNAIKRVAGYSEAGIQPTVGQTLGGMASRVEEKMQSLPFLGDAITAARNRAKDQLNIATINKTLAPIGESVKVSGQQGVAEAGNKLSAVFDDAISRVKQVTLDPGFTQGMDKVTSIASALEPGLQQKLKDLINKEFSNRLGNSGEMSGQAFQDAYSALGKEASTFSGMSSPGARDYGAAVKQLQSELQSAAERTSNPDAQKALKAAREGWANLVRVESAATAAKGTGGVFTPGQLLGAVQKGDDRVRDRGVARGEALMQKWANQAQEVLGNKYPDSGTAGRIGMNALGVASGTVSPYIPIGLGLSSALYTNPVQKLLTKAITSRPADAAKYAEALRRAIPGISGATGLSVQPQQQIQTPSVPLGQRG
jgi:hypothetical protein